MSFAPDLRGFRVAVLGSTSGIGRATAFALATSGADVIIHGRRSPDAASAVADECLRLGAPRSHVLMADLADREAGDRLVDDAWKLWDGLDAWVHFAGADTLTGPGADLDFDAKLDLLLAVDVVSTLRLCRRVGSLMKARGRGVILTIGWDQAETGMEGDSGELFAATKGAIMCLSRSLSLSLAPEVCVNCLAPGWIKTSWGEQASDAWQARAVSEAPLHRWGSPEDVAHAARFLLSPDAGFLTGQTIRVNGGAIR